MLDMGIPRAFRTNSTIKYTNEMFEDYCNSLEIRVSSPYGRVCRERHRSGIQGCPRGVTGIPEAAPGFHLEETRGCTDDAETSLWLEFLRGVLNASIG